jgi:hypothetical protein
MQLNEYKEYYLPYVKRYNKKEKKRLEDILIENKVLEKEKLKEIENKCSDNVIGCIEEIGIPVIKKLEEWEFIKQYTYSVLYKSANIDKDVLLENRTKFNIEDENVEELSSVIMNPTIYCEDDLVMYKFSLKKKGYDPKTGEELKTKYPIVVVFYTNDNIVEIRYDSINGLFISEDYKNFYIQNVKSIKAWIFTILGLNLKSYLLESVVSNIEKLNNVVLDGKDMRFSDGGKACLEVGSNTAYTLPLLGELKNIIKENEEIFNESINIKQMLEIWIKTKEDEADYNWVTLRWKSKDEKKTKDIKVRFLFNYIEEDVALLNHYSGLLGMERMNNVTRCIIENTKQSN